MGGYKQQNGKLRRELKRRHINMITIGGAIGTGLFLASGFTVSEAGPGGGALAYAFIGVMIFFLMMSLGEMATFLPVSGSFQTYSDMFVHPAFGFAIGWNYWLTWSITVGIELVAGSIIMGNWFPTVPPVVWCTTLGLIILKLNLMSVKSYGEAEFWFASIKVFTIIAFIIVGVLMILGVIGDHPLLLSNFSASQGGPFPNGIDTVILVSFSAAFSFLGTEIVGVAAGETENPQVNVPKAIHTVFWRILLFYVGSMLVIGLVIPYQQVSVSKSPFTMVFSMAKIPGAAVWMNIVIITSIISSANSGLYVGSRMLANLAMEGKAPRVFGKINRKGIPIIAVLATTAVACTAFLTNFFAPETVYIVLVAIAALATIFSWFGIALSHYNFRKWLVQNGYSVAKLKFRAPFYPLGPVVTMIFCVIIIAGQLLSDEGRLSVYFGIPCFMTLLFLGSIIARGNKRV